MALKHVHTHEGLCSVYTSDVLGCGARTGQEGDQTPDGWLVIWRPNAPPDDLHLRRA